MVTFSEPSGRETSAPNGSAAITYDFDGDGQAETQFVFQQITGG